jgi:carbamoyl-phosphate synthase large subunit
MQPRVLVTGAGTCTCQSVIKGLRLFDRSVRILTVDMSPLNAGRYMSDRFFRVPPATHPEFVDTLLDICHEHAVQLLVPVVDYEFAVLARSRSRFADIGCRVALSPPETVAVCGDKLETYLLFARLGVQTARAYSKAELARGVDLPAFAKPRFGGRSSIGARVVRSKAELAAAAAESPELCVSELLAGAEHSIDVLCDFEGRAIGGAVRERLETKSGVSTKGRTVDDPAMLADALRIAEALKIHGPCNVQAFKNDRGTFYFEVNPRFSGALALSIAAGFNAPAALLHLALGEPVPPLRARAGVTMLRHWQETFVEDGA